jgi:hypothetical protein
MLQEIAGDVVDALCFLESDEVLIVAFGREETAVVCRHGGNGGGWGMVGMVGMMGVMGIMGAMGWELEQMRFWIRFKNYRKRNISVI